MKWSLAVGWERRGPDGGPSWREVSDGDYHWSSDSATDAIQSRVSVLDGEGHRLNAFGREADPAQPGAFIAAHGIAVDSRGDLYVAEVTYSMGVEARLVPRGMHDFQKFSRTSG